MAGETQQERNERLKAQAMVRAAVEGGAKVQIIQPEGAAEKLKAEKIQKVQAHLDMQDVERDAAESLFQSMLCARIEGGGMPDPAERAMLRSIAKDLTIQRYHEKWTARAKLFAELGVTEMDKGSAHWIWAAKQHGVDLVPPPPPKPADPPLVIVPDAPIAS